MSENGTTYQDGYIKWLRSHVGHEQIYLVYSTALVFDTQGRLLVQERYDFDWLSVPGGALEPGESLLDCTRREVFEETGIHCTVERFLGVFSHPQYNLLYPNGDQVQPWTVGFLCQADSTDIQVDGREALHAAFRPVEEVRHRLPLQYQHILAAAERHPTEAAFEPVYFDAELRPHYPILRARVGKERVILSGGTAIIFNEQGKLLSIHEKRSGLWDLPSGLADLGETTSGTIVREVREETGLLVEPVRTLGIYSDPAFSLIEFSNGDEAHIVDLLLECKIIGGAIQPDGEETDQIDFLSLDELAAQPGLSPARQQMYADLKQREHAPFIR